MIELLISACLLSGGGCRDHAQLYDAREVSLMTCMIASPQIIARWEEDHPRWAVQRWRCRLPEQRGAKA